jgi:hypothetical protein
MLAASIAPSAAPAPTRVDEQDDVTAGLDLFEDLLETFLEVTAVTGAGDQRTEIEGVELLAGDGLGHLALDDGLREAFDDRCLADAGFADEHGVVLGATRQDLHDTLDLFLAPDHRIELVLACMLREVPTELVEHQGALRGLGAAPAGRLLGSGVTGKELDDLLAHTTEIGAELYEHLSGNAFTFADEPKQDVLGTDVVVAELQSLAERQLEDLLSSRSEWDMPRRG